MPATSTDGPDDPQKTEVTPATFAPADLGATTPMPRAAADTPEPTVAEAAAPKSEMAMPPAPPMRGIGLVWRIFLAVAGTVVLVLAGTLLVGGKSSQRAAQTSLDESLHQTADLIADLLKSDEDRLAQVAAVYASNPSWRSPIEQTGLGDSVPAAAAPKGGRGGRAAKAPAAAPIDSSNFLDLAKGMADETGASWVQLTDRNGVRLARSDQPDAPNADLSDSPLIAKALGGETMHGFGVASDSILFDATSIPIYGAGTKTVVGVAMLARNIADSTASRIMKLTGSEVVFFGIDGKQKVHVVAATGRLVDRTHTAGLLTSLITAEQTKGKAATDSASNMGQMMMGMEMDSTTHSTMAKDNAIDGHMYVWTIKPLMTAADRPVGGVLALRDKDLALAPFTTMQWSVLRAGAVALILAVLFSFALARGITQPVRALVGAARRAAEGDYSSEIPEAKGEIGALADAFNQLLEDLREKQSLVDFLQGPSSGKTMMAQANRMSVDGGTAPRGGGKVATLEPGSMLGNRYEIKRVLGAGGMGMVYKATDKELGETVAIKTLRPEMMDNDPAALDRFRSEIRLARKISHRNVVRTHDIGEAGGLYFITMEFVEGSSLKDLIISRGRLPAAAVISIGKQLMRALEVAHEAGVIHRDIKPQNMVVEADGTVKVMDFGIARLQMRSEGHTQAGMVVGTPEYMSPEQLKGDELDGRADLYSAGVVLYESLTGKLPHIADTPGALIGKVLSETPVAPRVSVAEVSPVLSGLIMQALAKNRDERPRSALEFLGLLERA